MDDVPLNGCPFRKRCLEMTFVLRNNIFWEKSHLIWKIFNVAVGISQIPTIILLAAAKRFVAVEKKKVNHPRLHRVVWTTCWCILIAEVSFLKVEDSLS
jgi:hypothetical protein